MVPQYRITQEARTAFEPFIRVRVAHLWLLSPGWCCRLFWAPSWQNPEDDGSREFAVRVAAQASPQILTAHLSLFLSAIRANPETSPILCWDRILQKTHHVTVVPAPKSTQMWPLESMSSRQLCCRSWRRRSASGLFGGAHIETHAGTHTHTQTNTLTHPDTQRNTQTRTDAHRQTQRYTDTLGHAHKDKSKRTCAHTQHTRIYVYLYIHTDIYQEIQEKKIYTDIYTWIQIYTQTASAWPQ